MPEDDDQRDTLKRLLDQLSVVSQLLRAMLLADAEPGQVSDGRTLESENQTSPSPTPVLSDGGVGGLDGDLLRRLLLNKAVQEAREAEYKTNDLVEISGSFESVEKMLRINGARPIHLNKAEFVVLQILTDHALKRRGLSSRRRVLGGKFLGVDEIFRAVEEWRRDEPTLAAFWANAAFPTVHRTVWELRRKITDVGANPNLIETGPPGEGGYRLSTSAFNITAPLRG